MMMTQPNGFQITQRTARGDNTRRPEIWTNQSMSVGPWTSQLEQRV